MCVCLCVKVWVISPLNLLLVFTRHYPWTEVSKVTLLVLSNAFVFMNTRVICKPSVRPLCVIMHTCVCYVGPRFMTSMSGSHKSMQGLFVPCHLCHITDTCCLALSNKQTGNKAHSLTHIHSDICTYTQT